MIVPSEAQVVTPRQPGVGVAAAATGRRPLPAALRAALFALAGAATVGCVGALALAAFGGSYERDPFVARAAPLASELEPDELARRTERAERRLAGLAPGNEVYVVVDSYANRLRIFKNGELVRDALCSTGSGVRLRDPRNGKEWIFDTPQGELKILRKVKDPIWVKPDWAFIEEGFEPPRNMRDRVDDFSLGDYGLYMRDGYIIHGTIFKTLLGKRVTHGCIRLGDEDLEFAYKNVPVGARVFLF